MAAVVRAESAAADDLAQAPDAGKPVVIDQHDNDFDPFLYGSDDLGRHHLVGAVAGRVTRVEMSPEPTLACGEQVGYRWRPIRRFRWPSWVDYVLGRNRPPPIFWYWFSSQRDGRRSRKLQGRR